MLEAVGFGIATAVWRYVDGSDKRPKGSNLIGFALVLAAAIWAAGPLSLASLPLLIPTLTAAYLLVRGMPGWTEWRPMLLGFALPTAVASLAYHIASVQLLGQYPSTVGAILYGASGLAVAGCYVLLSQIEVRHPSWFRSFSAEKWGRLSYGFIVGGLALL